MNNVDQLTDAELKVLQVIKAMACKKAIRCPGATASGNDDTLGIPVRVVGATGGNGVIVTLNTGVQTYIAL